MADNNISLGNLEFQIEATGSDKAVRHLNSLSNSLNKLSSAVSSVKGFGTAVNNIKKLSDSVTADKADAFKKLASAMSSLQRVSDLRISASVATQIGRIVTAAQSLRDDDIARIERLGAALQTIGTNGDVPTVSAIAAGQKVTIVGVPGNGPDAYAMLAKADNNSMNSDADMKGKKIATVIGSTGHNLIKKLLSKNGLTFDDIELINIAAGDAGIVLSTGQVDAVVIWEPNVTRLVDNGTAKIIAKGSDTNLRGTNTFLARDEYIKANPDVISVILEQFARAVKELPNTDAATLQKVADDLKLTPEQVLRLYKKYGFAVQCDAVDTAALQDTCSFLVSIGRLEAEYSVKDYVDNSYFNNSKAKTYLK